MALIEPVPKPPSRSAPRRKRDLQMTPLPVPAPQDWREPVTAVQSLYNRAEAKAIETIDWYLAKKRAKKRASRFLRASAILLGSAGALEPIVTATSFGSVQAKWGYLLLGAAAACVAFDRFFGVSTGWMRCMQSAQLLQTLVEKFQYDWIAPYLIDTDSAPPLADRLTLLRTFGEDVSQVVNDETAEWAREFSSNLTDLQAQAASKDQKGDPKGLGV